MRCIIYNCVISKLYHLIKFKIHVTMFQVICIYKVIKKSVVVTVDLFV